MNFCEANAVRSRQAVKGLKYTAGFNCQLAAHMFWWLSLCSIFGHVPSMVGKCGVGVDVLAEDSPPGAGERQRT